MSAMTNYLEGKLLDHLFRGVGFAAPATLYVALVTAVADGESGSVTEVTGGSYARVAVACNTTNWTPPASGNGTVSNAAEIVFPTPTAGWGTVVGAVIYDAATGGNALLYGTFAARTINNGDAAPKFAAAQLSFQIDN